MGHQFSLLKNIKQLFLQVLDGKHPLTCLNISQFLGVLNDNVYKFLMIFLLLSTLGPSVSSNILSAAGAIYVIPFLLFSSAAGILADRFSKQRLILLLKGFEVFVMLLAVWAFSSKNTFGCYAILFFLGTHSALLGPSKYGILPEIVPKEKVAKANSYITSFMYLAIIVGTFLASFLTERTQKNYVLSAFACLCFSLIGFAFAFKITKTQAQKSQAPIRLFFLKDIYHTIKECQGTSFLVPSILGSSYFLFVGAFTQLNIIPFAIESLHVSEYVGGYLFLLTAIGIAGGSLLTGRLLKNNINLSLPCLCGLGISLLFLLLFVFSSSIVAVSLLLILLGLLGGTFVLCFDTFIQLRGPAEKRGQRIAAANFLGFVGVLIASFFLYLLGLIPGLSASGGFVCMGLLTLFVSIAFCLSLLELFFPFLSSCFFHKIKKEELAGCSLFVLKELQLSLLLQMVKASPHCRILFYSPEKISWTLQLLSLSPAVRILPMDLSVEEALVLAKDSSHQEVSTFLYLGSFFSEDLFSKGSLFSPFQKKVCLVDKQGEKICLSIHRI